MLAIQTNQAVTFTEDPTVGNRSGYKKQYDTHADEALSEVVSGTVRHYGSGSATEDLDVSGTSAIEKFVAALVRTRGVDRLDDAVISRHWLATDMRITIEALDRLLKLLRWQGLIGLPNDHLVTVIDASRLKKIAVTAPDIVSIQKPSLH